MTDDMPELGRFNLVVVGPPGCGRATLVNAVFGADVIHRGGGQPVADGVDFYQHPDGILGVYVAPAPAAAEQARTTIAALAELTERKRAEDLSEQVHAAWFLVRWGEPEPSTDHLQLVQELAAALPVVFVVTAVPANLAGQADQEAVRFARFVQSHLLPLSPSNTVFLTNARIDPEHATPLHGLAELAEATFATAPEAARRAQAAAGYVQRQHRGRTLPLTSLRVRAQGWQQQSLPLRSAMRSYWSRFRPR